jgi:hypothetical protein
MKTNLLNTVDCKSQFWLSLEKNVVVATTHPYFRRHFETSIAQQAGRNEINIPVFKLTDSPQPEALPP